MPEIKKYNIKVKNENVNIIDYLNNNNIKWFPLTINDKKEPIFFEKGNYMPKTNDFKNLKDYELKNRQHFINDTDYIAIDTNDIQQLDIDNPELLQNDNIFNLKNTTPYFLSINRKMPHYFIVFKNKFKDCINLIDADLLLGQWAYCHKNIYIYNSEMKPDIISSEFILNNFEFKWKEDENKIKNIDNSNIENINEIKVIDNIDKKIISNVDDKDLEKIENVLKNIDEKYYNNYYTWCDIGFVCKNEMHKKDILVKNACYELWKKYSKLINECKFKDKDWNNNELAFNIFYSDKVNNDKKENNKKIRIGTLIKWIKDEQKFNDEKLKLEYSLNYKNDDEYIIYCFTENTIKPLLKSSNYIDKYKYCEVADTWFMINNNNVWIKRNKPFNNMKIDIINILLKFLNEYKDKLNNDCKDIDNEYEKKRYQGLINEINKNIKLTNKNKFINECIISSIDLIKDDNFNDKLNNNINLLCFEDQLFDFTTYQFRNIEINDYVSITTGYTIKDFERNDIIKDKIINIIKDMFYDDEEYQYVFNQLSLSLFGKNINQDFIICTGSGSNGKSILFNDLLKSALGNYFLELGVSSITIDKKNANEHSAFGDLEGRRVVIFNEPPDKRNLIGSIIKNISGDSTFKARAINEKEKVIKNQCTPFILCNTIPNFDKLDGGVERRYKIIDFGFKFLNENDDLYKTTNKAIVKQRDENLGNDFITKEYYGEFILMLIDNYINIDLNKNYKFILPPRFKLKINDYKEVNMPVKSFVDKYFIITLDDKDKLKKIDMYELYKKYGECSMGKQSFYSELKGVLSERGVIEKSSGGLKYFGIKIIEEIQEECLF